MSSILFIHLSLGPLMLLISFLYKRFPPKNINYWYGYRTARSMKSQTSWDCANLYNANALVVVSLLCCLVQGFTLVLFNRTQSILWSAITLVVLIIAAIPMTEAHLKKRGFKLNN